MNYDSMINTIGDVQYLLTDIPHNVSVESMKLDKSGIEIILARGIEDFAEDNALELAEALIPSDDGNPPCLVNLATSEALPVHVWQFDDAEEAPTE